jgi:hypothetical protein
MDARHQQLGRAHGICATRFENQLGATSIICTKSVRNSGEALLMIACVRARLELRKPRSLRCCGEPPIIPTTWASLAAPYQTGRKISRARVDGEKFLQHSSPGFICVGKPMFGAYGCNGLRIRRVPVIFMPATNRCAAYQWRPG